METSSKSNYGDQIKSLLEHINGANAIVVGAGSGLSASAGFRHYYERDETFLKYFSEFEKKYGYHSTFDGFYYRYRTSEERWAFLGKGIRCQSQTRLDFRESECTLIRRKFFGYGAYLDISELPRKL